MQPVEETASGADSSADSTQTAEATDDSAIDIGTEDYLEVPENGAATETG